MKEQIILSLALLVVLPCHAVAAKASESEPQFYNKGRQYYAAGHYDHARKCLEYTSKKSPSHWPSHYHLANTYMKLGMKPEARESYAECMKNMPDFATYKSCQSAIKAIDQETGARDAASQAAEQRVNAGETEKAVHERLEVDRNEHIRKKIKELKARKEAILEEGRREAAAIRADAERQIEDFARNTNQFIQNSRTGEVRLGITSSQANAIRSEAEVRARQVMSNAEVRARGIQIPREPD